MRVKTVPLLFAVMLVSVVGTILALRFLGFEQNASAQRVQIVTLEVMITATPNPNATIPVIIVTATPDKTQVAVPTSILSSVEGVTVIPATRDVNTASLSSGGGDALANLPQNCITHTIQSGDTPFGIAAQYEANPFTMLDANGLTEESSRLLQIGDVLIVPLEGCPLEQLPNYVPQSFVVAGASTSANSPIATPTLSATEESTESLITPTTGPTATLTLAPTAQNAQVQIVGVDKAGDVTAEGVRIRNTGNTINVTGWTLTDADGNVYTFGEQLIFSNTEITLYTRVGQNTPIALFWGKDTAVWGESGDVITLRNRDGVVQATARLNALINLNN